MAKSPERPTSKTGSTGPARSRASKAAQTSSRKSAGSKTTASGPSAAKTSRTRSTSTGSSSGKTQLTPKPTTIDLDPNEVTKTAAKSTPQTSAQGASKSASKAPIKAEESAQKSTEPSKSATAGKSQSPADTTAPKSDKPAATPKSDTKSGDAPVSAMKGSETTKPSMTPPPQSPPPQSPPPQSARPEAVPPRAHPQKGGRTSILAMLLAGGVGGIVTLLGAYALLGSGILAGDDTSRTDATQAQLSELSSTVSGLSDQSNSLSQSIASLDTQMAALTDQPTDTGVLDSLQTELAALGERIDQELSASQAGLADLEATAAGQTELQEALGNVQAQLASLSETVTFQNETISSELSGLADRQGELETSIAEGEAGEGPALAALEARLTALSDQIVDQEANVPAPVREELSAIGDMVTNLQDQLSIMESLQITAQQQQVDLQSLTEAVEGVEGTVKRVAGKTDRLEETVATPPEMDADPAMEGARLAYVQSALKTAIAEGMPFAGLVSQASSVMADSGSTMELPEEFMLAAASGLTPLPELAGQIAEARSAYEASLSPAADVAETPPDADNVTAQGLLDGIMQGAKTLVTVRSVDKTDAAPPDLLASQLTSAEAAASTGDLGGLSASLEEISGNAATSDSLQQSVALWQAQTRHHQTAAGVQDQLDAVQQSIWAETSKGDPS